MLAKVYVNLLIWCGAVGRAPPRPWRASRDVLTSQGAARGYLAARHYAFLGLPYARPPTQRDTFKAQIKKLPGDGPDGINVCAQAPQPPPRWDGTFEATHHVKCLQTNGEGSKDCLVVNVFVPEHAAACCMLPVLVHVHGGGFQNGWGAYQPPIRLIHDFVVVTFNYRLGVHGFLCLGTVDAPGNAGLKDQVAALYWVHRNIANFGGNPLQVTLYGTGSGAASVQLLLLTKSTDGLIHRVILESGSALSPSSIVYNPASTAVKVATALGFRGEGVTEDLVKFYQKISISQLVNVTTMFLPCIENNFYNSHTLIDRSPIEILSQGDYDKVPVLIAYTNTKEISLLEKQSVSIKLIQEHFEDLLPNNLEFDSSRTKTTIADLIKEFYFGEVELRDNLIQNWMDYMYDIFIEYPIVKFSAMYASKSMFPLYIMKFSYRCNSEKIPAACRGDALKYIFARDTLEFEEEEIAQKIVTLWINFMNLGDPTPLTTSMVPLVWQPLDAGEAQHIIAVGKVSCLLYDRTLTMRELPSSLQISFWDYIYSKFYKNYTFVSEDLE